VLTASQLAGTMPDVAHPRNDGRQKEKLSEARSSAARSFNSWLSFKRGQMTPYPLTEMLVFGCFADGRAGF
jgi:homoserine trans-succinylase